jgi:excisionase family DNA binding protein
MPATITRRLVSLNDAADALAVSTRTVRRYIADGHLDAVRLGRKTLRIKVDSVERFIDARPVGNWRRDGRAVGRIRGCGADTSQLGRQPRALSAKMAT